MCRCLQRGCDDPAADEAGIPVRVMVSPVVPALTDHELEAILTAAQEAGAVAASSIMLRLPREVSGLFQDWLAEALSRPCRADHGAGARIARGAGLRSRFGHADDGQGEWADLMRQRFKLAHAAGSGPQCRSCGRDLLQCRPKRATQSTFF